jgi:hypothetical protein
MDIFPNSSRKYIEGFWLGRVIQLTTIRSKSQKEMWRRYLLITIRYMLRTLFTL